MKISLLQPKIERGNILNNANHIQKLIDKSKGDLLVLPEYVFTGSLVLEPNANINQWILDSDLAKKKLKIPKNKILLTNSLIKLNNNIYNCSELLPINKRQIKVFPDNTEKDKGIKAGNAHETFKLFDKKFKILICTDLRYWTSIKTDDADFILFIFHFTKTNYDNVIMELKKLAKQRQIPILASSLVSDKNIGFSTYINGNICISISDSEDLLEVEL